MRTKYSLFALFFILILALAFAGCNQPASKQAAAPASTPAFTKAVAVMHPTEGNAVQGIVTFTKVEGGIKIVADIEGLTPGKHGFHIHQFGDCSRPDGKSAGGHFNPDGNPHAGPDAAKRHVGDLGNLEAGEDGKAHYERVDTVISFSGAHNIIGRGVIIHAGEDDLTSQPTGAAGARVACGVIGIAKSE